MTPFVGVAQKRDEIYVFNFLSLLVARLHFATKKNSLETACWILTKSTSGRIKEKKLNFLSHTISRENFSFSPSSDENFLGHEIKGLVNKVFERIFIIKFIRLIFFSSSFRMWVNSHKWQVDVGEKCLEKVNPSHETTRVLSN
jgi:hypothetical protein